MCRRGQFAPHLRCWNCTTKSSDGNQALVDTWACMELCIIRSSASVTSSRHADWPSLPLLSTVNASRRLSCTPATNCRDTSCLSATA